MEIFHLRNEVVEMRSKNQFTGNKKWSRDNKPICANPKEDKVYLEAEIENNFIKSNLF